MPKPPAPTGKKPNKRRELAAWLAETRPEQIGEAEFAALHERLAPVSESYLRKLLRDSGIRLAPLVEGVRQANFEELEASLTGLLAEYLQAGADRRKQVRTVVITAKDHARFAASKNPEKREMILWMVTWLENPPLFSDWVRLRIRNLARRVENGAI